VSDTVALLRTLLGDQAPHLLDRPLVEIPGGQDNWVVRIGDDLVARLPRHEDAVPLIRNELRWLRAAAAGLPVAAPVPVVDGKPSEHFARPWSVCRWVPGETADRAPYDVDAMVAGLVGLLRALHRPAPPGAPHNPWRAVPLRAREDVHARVLADLRHPRADRLVAELARLAEVPGPEGPKVWVHGDLHPANLVVRDGRLSGLIDWGDLHAGDRAVDLSAVWMLLPPDRHADVRAGLAADDDTWARARGWALVLGVMFARIGHREADPWFSALAETTLARACPDELSW
jgi:aminoglycoside phosphotransferase (APT) family kinase protein